MLTVIACLIRRYFTAGLPVPLMLFLVACGQGSLDVQEPTQNSSLSLSPPARLLQSRAIDPGSLVLNGSINDTPLSFVRNGGSWSASLVVPPGEALTLNLSWLHNGVSLATLQRSIAPLSSDDVLLLQNTDYSIDSLDDDADSINNFTEVACGSNPEDSNDPGSAAAFAGLQNCVALSDTTLAAVFSDSGESSTTDPDAGSEMSGGEEAGEIDSADSTAGGAGTGESGNGESEEDGSGSSNNSGSGTDVTLPVAAPQPVILDLDIIAPRKFRFSWNQSDTATHYILYESIDGSSGVVDISGEMSADTRSRELTVPLFARVNARYLLEACNSRGCSSSSASTIDIPDADLVNGIGVLEVGAGDGFERIGTSLALDDDGTTLAIAASSFDSAVSAFRGGVYFLELVDGQWIQQQLISDPFDERSIGGNITLSGDGMTLAAKESNEFGGAVRIYRKSGSSWALEASLLSDNQDVGDGFGISIALTRDGNTLVAGASGESSAGRGDAADPNDNSAIHAGAAYVFTRSDGSWRQRQYLKASNADRLDDFGGSVDISSDGNYIVVGAFGEQSNSASINGSQFNNNAFAAGAVYVFRLNGSRYVQQAYLKAADTQSSSRGSVQQFGSGVSTNADASVLAVHRSDFYSESSEGIGGAYVFRRDGDIWSQTVVREHTNPMPYSSSYGVPLLSNDGSLMVAPATRNPNLFNDIVGQDPNSLINPAGAFVYAGTGGNLNQLSFLSPKDNSNSERFASGIALSGDGRTIVLSDPDNRRLYFY